MIEAYLDESGTHDASKVVGVAAYASSHEEWVKFENVWIPQLVSHGLEYFHGVNPACDLLREPLVCAIEAQPLIRGWLVTVNKAIYKANATHQLRSALGNPYAIAAFGCAAYISRWAKINNLGSVAFVIEHGQPNVDFVRRLIESLIGDDNFAIASVSVATKKDFVPLQTADLLAHCGGTVDYPWLERLIDHGQALHAHLEEQECRQLSADMAEIFRRHRHRKRVIRNAAKRQG